MLSLTKILKTYFKQYLLSHILVMSMNSYRNCPRLLSASGTDAYKSRAFGAGGSGLNPGGLATLVSTCSRSLRGLYYVR